MDRRVEMPAYRPVTCVVVVEASSGIGSGPAQSRGVPSWPSRSWMRSGPHQLQGDDETRHAQQSQPGQAEGPRRITAPDDVA
jgi:hypothetical protein